MSAADARPFPRLVGAQAAASDPRRHVWLAASAGTGKTQVLSARVFRLLLRGTAPEAILCLTFTKAGAAEMAGRINARLAAWVRMPEEELGRDLLALGERVDAETRRTARTLFAKLLDAPGGGLRIQTIHGFCQSLLAAFPLEAGLIPGFRPLEPREEGSLAREALSEMLVAERAAGRTRTIDAIGALSLRLGEGGAETFLTACAKRPGAMRALPTGDGVTPFVRRALGLPPVEVLEHLAGCCGDDSFDLVGLRRIAAANRSWGTATGAGRADIVEAWLGATPAERVGLLGDLIGVVRTKSGEPAKAGLEKLRGLEPDYEALGHTLGECCSGLLALVPLSAFADLYAGALTAGRDYATAYVAAKRRAGAVDFDDLIRATVDLLQQPGMGDWVRYKLDQDIEHVLIDEAQDTNLDQWTIVESLVREFFAGAGTRGVRTRTLFTVGDHKQAIFGFQGTDPVYFQAAAQRFVAMADALVSDEPSLPDYERAMPMAQLSLTHSFRSTRPVLEFVDAALAVVPDPGLGTPLELHASEVPGPGVVELWPPEIGGDVEGDEEEWVDDATRKVARRIARQVREWLDNGSMLESKGRLMRPEDVMVLVKRRGELASLIVARLYAEGVAVAGIDRLRLNAPLAVQDLLAAIRFVLQPQDDLALANLLVSPLLGWTQEELLAAAVPRTGALWQRLRDQSDPRLEPLRAMLARADLTTPYQFLEELLSGPLDGRRKLLTRLGAEARDPIEELLSAALAFEDTGTPSLQAFLDWFDRGDVDIVRDPSQPRDAVRVMTVHGAKGLQAPVVILADALIDPRNSPRSLLRWHPGESMPDLPLIRPRKNERSGPLADVVSVADRRELEEHWRLFYVAATRAEERLVITGALGGRADGPPPDSWYAAADAAMTALGVKGEGTRIFVGHEPAPPVPAISDRTMAASPPVTLPSWTREEAPVEARPPRPLAPSALGDDAVADPPPSPAMRAAAERGRLLHALFERLPPVPPAERRAAAGRWLAEAGGLSDATARAKITDAACRVINDPRFGAVFDAGSLAEAPIAAVVAGGAVVAGTVDRLLVTDDRIVVVDFKTGRAAPATLAEVPPYHVRQMAAYVAALRVIFPDRPVAAALLYTAGPELFELSDELIAAHLPT